MNTETEIDRMKRIPIEDFLARLGYHPVQRRANAVWYRSPYREEKTPSFKVNPEKNLWYDFGEGKGGNIFALAGEFIRSDDFLTQVKYVAEMFCDRIAACRVYQKEKYTDASPYDYFQHSKGHLCRSEHGHGFIHPETSELLTRWLLLLKEQGEDAAFRQIRQELKELRRS